MARRVLSVAEYQKKIAQEKLRIERMEARMRGEKVGRLNGRSPEEVLADLRATAVEEFDKRIANVDRKRAILSYARSIVTKCVPMQGRNFVSSIKDAAEQYLIEQGQIEASDKAEGTDEVIANEAAE